MTDDKERAMEILHRLEKTYPDAPATYLNYSSPFEMLIATILSARATDAGVNKVTPILFNKYPNPAKLAEADQEDLAQIIRPCGSYNRKASYIKNTSKMIIENFRGEIPQAMDDLILFPGVSRKTANVVLQTLYGLAVGIIVDTHIMRVTIRLGFSRQDKKPDKIEQDLMRILPQEKWMDYARLIGALGRQLCRPAHPKCSSCSINQLCPSAVIDD